MNLNKLTNLLVIFVFMFAVESVAQQQPPEPMVISPQGQARSPRPFIGVQMMETDDESGVRIARVVPDSPADKAGVKVDDVMLRIGDVETLNRIAVVEVIRKQKIGDQLNVTLRRNDGEVQVDLTLGDSHQFLSTTEPRRGQPAKFAFPSKDGLEVTAELYLANDDKKTPFIILCHQAGWSRGEYREIAPKLVELGFNCLAIDQRSGGAVNEVANETARKAAAAEKGTTFVDAEQDMLAAINWARAKHAEGKLILWGSSYSAALALRIAGEDPQLVDGVLAFAPGEYFARFEKPKAWIESSAKKIEDPAFITSAKDEFPRWESIYNAIPLETKMKFVPETKGNHGSRALWAKFDDSPAYWTSVTEFLGQFK